MPDPERQKVDAYYRALCAQDYDLIERFLDDNSVWSIGGPIDALPFCGTYRGKVRIRSILEHKIAETLGRRKIVPDDFLIDRGRGALLGRLVGTLPGGQTIAYRIAQFFNLRNGIVSEHTTLLDSFDAVEQVIGRRIAVTRDAPQQQDENSIVPI